MQHPFLLISHSLSHKHSLLLFPVLHMWHSYTNRLLLLNHISMGMHGIPHMKGNNIKNKIICDLLAHFGVKDTEWRGLPDWSFIFHKFEAEATKGGVRASLAWFLQNGAGFTGTLHGEINICLMHSYLKTQVHITDFIKSSWHFQITLMTYQGRTKMKCDCYET